MQSVIRQPDSKLHPEKGLQNDPAAVFAAKFQCPLCFFPQTEGCLNVPQVKEDSFIKERIKSPVSPAAVGSPGMKNGFEILRPSQNIHGCVSKPLLINSVVKDLNRGRLELSVKYSLSWPK